MQIMINNLHESAKEPRQKKIKWQLWMLLKYCVAMEGNLAVIRFITYVNCIFLCSVRKSTPTSKENKVTGFINFCYAYKYGSVFKNNKRRNTSFVKSCNGAMSQKFLM